MTRGSPHALPAPTVLVKFQGAQSMPIPAEPWQTAAACQTPSVRVSPALGISKVLKMAHRLSPSQPPPRLPWGPAEDPPVPGFVWTFRGAMLVTGLGGTEGGPAGGRVFWCSQLHLWPRVSQSWVGMVEGGQGEARMGGRGLIQPERRSPLQLAGHQNPHKMLPCGASPRPVSFTLD